MYFDSPQDSNSNPATTNTFFDEKFNKDLFASFAMGDETFYDPMACSTPTPTSSNSSTFFSAIIDTGGDTHPDSILGKSSELQESPFHTTDIINEPSFTTRMRESMGQKQIMVEKEKEIFEEVQKPKAKIEKKKKPKKFKPTNLQFPQKEVADQVMKPPANKPSDDGTYSQVNYEITSSGANVGYC